MSTSRVSLGYVSQWHSGWDTENTEEPRAVAEILRARAHSRSLLFVPGFLSGFLDNFLSLYLLMFNEKIIYHLLKKKEEKPTFTFPMETMSILLTEWQIQSACSPVVPNTVAFQDRCCCAMKGPDFPVRGIDS